MKILFFSHGKRANGGAERCLLDLVKGLKQARESWEIYVVFPAKDELWEMTRPYLSGYAFIRQPWWLVRPKKRNWWKRLLLNLKKSSAIRKTRDYIREIKPDITITNTLATPIGAIASQAENIPHDWFIHEIPELARNLTYLFCEDSCLEKISSLSQRILVPSDFAGKYYTNKLSSPEKIDVVYQSVEANPPKRTEPNQNFTIGMLGNFEPNKGQHIAIEALREVVKKYPDTRLLLIGGNNSRYAQELEKRITEYNLRQNVSIVPDKPFGQELIKEGYNGFLYNRESSGDLAKKIILLRQTGHLPEMKQNALKSVENRFSIPTFAEEFISIINSKKA